MASNYPFFCLLFSNGAQPRKSWLPLLECFDSGTANGLISWTNMTMKVPKLLQVLSCPPRTPKGAGCHDEIPCTISIPSATACLSMARDRKMSLLSSPFSRVPSGAVSVPGKKATSLEVCDEMVALSQTSGPTIILGARGGSRIKGPDPSSVSSLSTDSCSAGIS